MASTSGTSVAPVVELEAAECAICYLGEGDASAPLRVTECGHTYCDHCIGSYSLKVPPPSPVLCPMCRAPLGETDLPSTLTISVVRDNSLPFGAVLHKSGDDEHFSLRRVADAGSEGPSAHAPSPMSHRAAAQRGSTPLERAFWREFSWMLGEKAR